MPHRPSRRPPRTSTPWRSCRGRTTADGTVTITDCDSGATGDLVIPASIDDKLVTTIGNSAFSSCSSLTSVTSVTIPDIVTTIGDDAFSRCSSLTSATFDGDAPTMGDGVFDDADSGFTVYFYEGALGFTTPTWEGYPSEMLPQPDGYEPDDGVEQATEIATDGTPLTRTISPVGDEDWAYFDLAMTSEVVLETSGESGNTRMWLYEADGVTLVEYNDDAGSLFSRIERTGPNALLAGRYYVKIDEYGDNEMIQSYDLSVTATPVVEVVSVPDPILEAEIRDALNIPTGDLTNVDLASLTSLDANRSGQTDKITDLTGMEYCVNLTDLSLGSNQISDLSPLAGLTELEGLRIEMNRVSDAMPLAGLVRLDVLDLSGNQISDLAPLEELANLVDLFLSNNQISDLTPLDQLTSLLDLSLRSNLVADLTPLEGLTQLQHLDLSGNQVNDLVPLAGLTDLKGLRLEMNQVIDIAPLAGLTGLMVLDLSSNQISNLMPLAGLADLSTLILWTNQIRDVTPLAGLAGLVVLDLDNNQIRDVCPLASNPGLGAGDELFLQGNPLSVSAYREAMPSLEQRGFALLQAGSVAGTVFDDLDGDGSQGVGEEGLAGVVVYLDADDNGQRDWTDGDADGLWDEGEGERWTLTAADGTYIFDDLYPTTYDLPNHVVRQIVPAGYAQTAPAAGTGHSVDLGEAEDRTGVDFANAVLTPAEVVGRHVFYNDSVLDGDAGTSAADDLAIDPDKAALLPGEAVGEAHVTGCNKGITGVMVDIAGLADPDALSTADVAVRVYDPADASAWIAGPAPGDVAVRPGEGVSGSDRVTLIWPAGAIANQWVEVTVHANERTGLADDDVFILGNLIADTNGDRAVDVGDLGILAYNWQRDTDTSIAVGDFNLDGMVDVGDLGLLAFNWGRHCLTRRPRKPQRWQQLAPPNPWSKMSWPLISWLRRLRRRASPLTR